MCPYRYRRTARAWSLAEGDTARAATESRRAAATTMSCRIYKNYRMSCTDSLSVLGTTLHSRSSYGVLYHASVSRMVVALGDENNAPSPTLPLLGHLPLARLNRAHFSTLSFAAL